MYPYISHASASHEDWLKIKVSPPGSVCLMNLSPTTATKHWTRQNRPESKWNSHDDTEGEIGRGHQRIHGVAHVIDHTVRDDHEHVVLLVFRVKGSLRRRHCRRLLLNCSFVERARRVSESQGDRSTLGHFCRCMRVFCSIGEEASTWRGCPGGRRRPHPLDFGCTRGYDSF